jgi:hypothetical protein
MVILQCVADPTAAAAQQLQSTSTKWGSLLAKLCVFVAATCLSWGLLLMQPGGCGG